MYMSLGFKGLNLRECVTYLFDRILDIVVHKSS